RTSSRLSLRSRLTFTNWQSILRQNGPLPGTEAGLGFFRRLLVFIQDDAVLLERRSHSPGVDQTPAHFGPLRGIEYRFEFLFGEATHLHEDEQTVGLAKMFWGARVLQNELYQSVSLIVPQSQNRVQLRDAHLDSGPIAPHATFALQLLEPRQLLGPQQGGERF